MRNEWTRITHWIPARACRTILTHSGGLSAGQLKTALLKASSCRRRSARMGTPNRVSRKWAIRSRRSCQGAPCPITITPTKPSDRLRLRAACNPKTETTGCPRDWRMSSRIDKILGRNSTCTIAVMFSRVGSRTFLLCQTAQFRRLNKDGLHRPLADRSPMMSIPSSQKVLVSRMSFGRE